MRTKPGIREGERKMEERMIRDGRGDKRGNMGLQWEGGRGDESEEERKKDGTGERKKAKWR